MLISTRSAKDIGEANLDENSDPFVGQTMQTKNVNETAYKSDKRRLDCSTGNEEGLYKPVPPPKPVPNNQKNQNGQESSRVQTVVEQSSRPISAIERNVTLDDNQVRSSGQNPAPEYRMPPLYGEEQSSNQTQQAANLQTHSSKFPRFEQPTKRFVRRREQDQQPCKNNTSIGRIT